MREANEPQTDNQDLVSGDLENDQGISHYFHENEVLKKVLSWEEEITYRTYDDNGDKISNGSARDVRKFIHKYLFDEFSRANTIDQLFDLYEALTSYELNNDSTLTWEIRPLVRAVLAKLITVAEQDGTLPEDLFKRIDVVAYRSEKDQDLGRPKYPQYHHTYAGFDSDKTYYHRNHSGAIKHAIRAISDIETSNEGQLELAAMKHRAGLEDYDYASQLLFIAGDRYKGAEEFAVQHIVNLSIDKPTDVELGIQILEELDMSALQNRDGVKLMDTALSKIVELITYCAETKKVNNAKKLLPVVKPNRIETQKVFRLGDLIAQANSFRKQLGQPLLDYNGDQLEQSVPSAMDTLMDVIINYGSNSLSDEERIQLEVAGALAGDIFTLGLYLRTTEENDMTIGDFIAAHPKMSAERIADKINPHRSEADSDDQLRDLRRSFGSVVFWKARRPGFGVVS